MFKHIAIERLALYTPIRMVECDLFPEGSEATVGEFQEILEKELTDAYEYDREYYDEIVSDKTRFLNRNPIYTLKYNKDNAITARGLCVILAEHGRFLDENALTTKETVHEINRGLKSNLKNYEPDEDVGYSDLLDSILAKIEKNHKKGEKP